MSSTCLKGKKKLFVKSEYLFDLFGVEAYYFAKYENYNIRVSIVFFVHDRYTLYVYI